MIEWIHPGIVILLGAFLIPFIKNKTLKQTYFLLLPLAGLAILILTSMGVFGVIPSYPDALHKLSIPFLQYTLELGRIDKLSMIFAYAFVIATFCINIFALKVKKDWEHVSAMVYFGSSLGAIFARDLITLFIFLEIMSWSALFLIWFRGTPKSRGAGSRYILWHVFSGLCVLAGSVMHVQTTGSIEFTHFAWGWGSEYLGYYLICLGFIINSACFPFHSWFSDTYPDSSITGINYMVIFTTKIGIYCLVRGFSGVDLLVWIGAISAVVALFMAVLENDARRLCCYHGISQLGYMICAAGIGTALAINGAISHAICYIFYGPLLLMGASAVLEKVGTCKFNETGGLYRYMPIAFWLYMVGGFAISGMPLFNGFVSKTMTIEAAELLHQPIVYLLLEGATVGTFLHTALKLPWNLWWQGKREPPANIKAKLKDSRLNTPIHMLVAMGILAFICIFIGVYPHILYSMLPCTVEFIPFTTTRLFSMMQLLLFTFPAFWLLRSMVLGHTTITLDTDWLVRKPGRWFIRFCENKLIKYAEFDEKKFFVVPVLLERLSKSIRAIQTGYLRHYIQIVLAIVMVSLIVASIGGMLL